MKRILSLILALTLVLGMVFTLASCGKMLNGKYQDPTGVTTYEFSGSKVTLTVALLGTKTYEGTYKIAENEEGEMTITFTFEDADAETYSGESAFAEGSENDVEYIKIGLVKYTKVK
ncbi:MAG: hypothetical protein IKC72_04670 [Clostridia bacterium]|nr:hypothetical protein [Clostridia bacterium]